MTAADGAGLVTLAVPCRADEPGLGRTLAAAAASWRRAAQTGRLEVLVCINGADTSRPLADVRRFAADEGVAAVEIDVDRALPVLPPAAAPVGVVALVTRRVGKPGAWNVLRRTARTPLAIFLDADVSFSPDAFGRLLEALATHPHALLASAKTTCAARPTVFESIMAAPYGVDFPNLSPQLYAARLVGLPVALPEDLLDPERWLELTLGRAAVARVPAVHVAVRLPGTVSDFFRQRIRIEMGKVQLACEYPGLADRGTPQPTLTTVLSSLGTLDVLRLGAYVALRSMAHAVAWWRYRRGEVTGVWRQARSTKVWDAA